MAPNAAYRHFASHRALFDAVRGAALAEVARPMPWCGPACCRPRVVPGPNSWPGRRVHGLALLFIEGPLHSAGASARHQLATHLLRMVETGL